MDYHFPIAAGFDITPHVFDYLHASLDTDILSTPLIRMLIDQIISIFMVWL